MSVSHITTAAQRSAIERERTFREVDNAMDFLAERITQTEFNAADSHPCIVGYARSKGFTGRCSACRGCKFQPNLA